MFYGCSSLISLPDISQWNTKNIFNLNSIFENCSLLTFIPNISKWKLNNVIEVKNIFKGCNSLIIIPDISKWKKNINNCFDVISDKTESLLGEEIKKSSDLSKDSFPFEGNNDFNSFNNNYKDNSIDITENKDLDDYYDNFYK